MMPRPDLSNIDPAVLRYIEALEAELARYQRKPKQVAPEEEFEALSPLLPTEAPTTINVISITSSGVAKRTARHLYQRQRRGGMGIFDLDTPEEDPPIILLTADESQSLLLFTNQARAFRLPVIQIPETAIRSRGQSIISKFSLYPDEHLIVALTDQVKGAIALVSQRGMVRYLRHHVFGEYMRPGTSVFDPLKFGELAAACWSSGDEELLITTRYGRGIRFSEKLVPPQGGSGIRLDENDVPVAITAVNEDSKVFFAEADGKGTIRLMSTFSANKSAGGGGKQAMKTDQLVTALTVHDGDDIFIISNLSKIIRFQSDEVPVKEGIVQGVNCMALRADRITGVAVTH